MPLPSSGRRRSSAHPARRIPAPLLAYELGGTLCYSGSYPRSHSRRSSPVVAGLTITASASFAHDIYASVIKKGKVSADKEVRVARIAAVVIGLVAIIGGILAKNQNIAFLVALAFAVAASANLPTIIYRCSEGFHDPGAVWSIYGGLISSVGLIIFAGVVRQGEPVIPDANFDWFPWRTRARVDPAGVLPRLAGQRHVQESRPCQYAEMEVRLALRAGAEKATVDH